MKTHSRRSTNHWTRFSHQQRRPFLSIVIPTKNEALCARSLLKRLSESCYGESFEVIFIDSSNDSTTSALMRAAIQFDVPVTIGDGTGLGLGEAVREGLRRARGSVVCVMDGDLQHPPEVIPELVAKIVYEHADLVIGTRFANGGSARGLGAWRLGSAIRRHIAKLMFSQPLKGVSDPMSGFFAIQANRINPNSLEPMGFKVLLEILVKNRNLVVKEVPYGMASRVAGFSKNGVIVNLQYIGLLFRLRRMLR